MDPVFKMYPPLRAAADRSALVDGLRDGTIDAVATDHAPHAAFEKDVTFEEAPRGIIGLETSAAVVHAAVGLDQAAFFERMAIAPARILGEAAGPLALGSTEITVFDPDTDWTYDRPLSKSSNSPWLGSELRGQVRAIVTPAGALTREEIEVTS